MKKVLLSAAILLAFATASNAGTPEFKSPSETKTETQSFTYYVIGEVTISGTAYYTVSLTPGDCSEEPLAKPCEILSSQAKDGNNRIPQSALQEVLTFQENY